MLYAKWSAFNYSIVYADGVDGEEIFSDTEYIRPYGSPTPVLGVTPKREGYTFVGWDQEISPTVEGFVRYEAVWVKNHVHEPVWIEGVNATCSVPGYKAYYECADCGYFEDEDCSVSIVDVELWKETDGRLTEEHIFTEKIQDKAHLVSGTGKNCRDAVKYYYGCVNCGAAGTEIWTSDTYGAHDIDTDFTSLNGKHYHGCLNEGCDYATGEVDCFGGEATCEARAVCAVCGNEYGELAPHIPEADDGDCTTAITCSVCGETTTAASTHADTNSDGKCDACGSDMPTEPGTDEPGTDEPGTDEPGTDEPGTDEPGTDDPGTDDPGTEAPELNDSRESEKGNFAEFINKPGAVVGGFVALGTAVIAIGFGIFALVWFVVKKKTWAEFISLFKKK